MTTRTDVILVQDFSNIRREAKASGTITPGMLVELEAAGTVKAHASAGGFAAKTFAIRDILQGNGIDDDYSANDLVSYHHLNAGDRVLSILAENQTIVIGDYLESAGDGKLRKYTSGVRLAMATEAKNTTAASSDDEVDYRCIVEIV